MPGPVLEGNMVIDFNTRSLAVAAFRDDAAEPAYLAAEAGLRAAWQGLYDDLAGGRVDWLSYHIGPVLYVLTRGIRPGAEVTRSVFWNTGGGLEAVSHHDFTQFDFSEMPDGVTVNAG